MPGGEGDSTLGGDAAHAPQLEAPATTLAQLAAEVALLRESARAAAESSSPSLEARLAASELRAERAELQLRAANLPSSAVPPPAPAKQFLNIHLFKHSLPPALRLLPPPTTVPIAPHLYSLHGEQFQQALLDNMRAAAAEEYQWFACVGPYLSAVRLSIQEELAWRVPGPGD